MKDEKVEIKLKVGELTNRSEVGRGIVRMDMTAMKSLNIREGDIVELENQKKTAAIAVRAYPADVGLNIIRMDGLLRMNASVGLGEMVKIRKAEAKEAKKVVLAPAQKGILLTVSPNLLRQNLIMRPLVKGDIISPSPVYRKRTNTMFDEFFGVDVENFFFGLPIGFPGDIKLMVVKTQPEGIVKVTDITEMELLTEAVDVEERKIPSVTYEDIGGLGDAIQKIREMVELPLRHPELFERLGIEPPKGILLYGPPGTGKTLLARAVANESGANFLTISGPEIMCVSENTPLISGGEIKSAKETFENCKKDPIGSGNNHVSYSAGGNLLGVNNPSLNQNQTSLIEATKVTVPYYYKVKSGTAEYDVSSNHPFLIFSKSGISWKAPPFFNNDEYIITEVISNLEKPKICFSDATKIKIPEQFDKKLSFLLGLIAGDGHVGKDNVTFTGHNRKLHDKFVEYSKEIFGINKFKEYRNEKADRTVIYSTDMVKFMNFLGFKSGKKDYIEFLRNWLIKLDSELFASFLLGMLVTDGTKGKHSLMLYSVDKAALELIKKAGFSRGLVLEGPKKHTNKLSDVCKLVLKGSYNLSYFEDLVKKLNIIDYGVVHSDRSYEYVPEDLIRILKTIIKNHKIEYGNNWKVEPYLNLRKRPTIYTLNTMLELIKNIELTDSEKSFVAVVKKIVNRNILLDKIVSADKIDKEKIMYDFGTLSDNFVTAYGHVMHNSKWYGQSEENLRKIFEDAEKNAPSIVFIDEVDAIAPKREEVTGEVERRVVAQLLSLMDGMRKRGRVVVIAATNRENAIDPALRRPGRFDREVEIGVPDRKGRREVLQIHTRNMPLDKSVSIDELAAKTHGFVGADVEALAKEAAISVLRRVLPEIIWKEEGEIPAEIMEKLIVTSVDFDNAMKVVEPSAMREVLVEIPNVKWSDIGGLEELKERLQEVIEWPLQHPDAFKRMGIKPPHGILLYGPPGCGKTLVVKAIANEAGLNFISIKGPELLSKWVGESEKAMREVFRRARQVSPAIVFFDEIDSLAPRRGLEMGSRVTEQVVSQLLTEMSGLEDLHDVIVIAATNRPDILDPALLRPGRFDRHMLVTAPDTSTREKIFKVHTKDMPLSKDVSTDKLAKETEGYSGADIEALCREAAIAALREDIKAKEVKWKHFEGMMKVIKPSLSAELMRAYHAVFEKMKNPEKKDELQEQLSYVG